MKVCWRTFLALGLSVGAAEAGSLDATLSEPVVVNFQTVATALWEERSTYYFGLNLNRQGTNLPGTVLSFSSTGTLPAAISFPGGTSGFTPGFVVGARRMAYDFVFGAELRHNAAPGATSSVLIYSTGGGFLVGAPVETRLEQRARISSDTGLRFVLGRDFSGMRFYGALGLASASVTTSVSSDALRNGVPIGMLPSQTRNMVGLHWALGMEVQVTAQMSVRLEYSNTDYGSFAYSMDNSDARLPTTHHIRASSQRLTLGAIFEF